jgi:hypothetical protein
MAGPYNLDTSDPTNTSGIAAFPANERTFRTTLVAYLGGAVDATTGMPFLPTCSVSGGPVAGTFPNAPTGALVINTFTGFVHLYFNSGTPASPVWTQV